MLGLFTQKPLDMGKSIVTICVGDGSEQADFAVHEVLIRKSSLFFENALKSPWKESQTRVVELPDLEPALFRTYVQCLYSGRIHVCLQETMSEELSEQYEKKSYEFAYLGSLYVLGDYIQDTSFKDIVIDAMLDTVKPLTDDTRDFPFSMLATFIYENTPKSSPLRKLLVDLTVWFQNSDAWRECQKDLDDEEPPAEFLYAVVLELTSGRSELSYYVGRDKIKVLRHSCRYHCHGDSPCYREMYQGDAPATDMLSTSKKHSLGKKIKEVMSRLLHLHKRTAG